MPPPLATLLLAIVPQAASDASPHDCNALAPTGSVAAPQLAKWAVPAAAQIRIGSPAPPGGGGVALWPGLAGGSSAANCPAGNARDNTPFPYEVGIDFVPVTLDDALGFHVVYSGKANASGSGVAFNVCLYLFALDDGSVLLFGGGYGDPLGPNTALNSAAFDAANVASAVRDCLGRPTAATPLHFVSPHWHGDHVNAAIIRALEAEGFPVVGLYVHADDALSVATSYGWTASELARFVLLPDGPCVTPIAQASSPLGNLWLSARSGHTAGAVDLVLDVLGNAEDRFLVQGSVMSGVCTSLPSGTRQQLFAHQNALLSDAPQVVTYGSGVNPPGTLAVKEGSPRPGTMVTLALNDPTAAVQAPAFALLYGAFQPAPGYPSGPLVRIPGAGRSYELLVDPLLSVATKRPDVTLWFGPSNPAEFSVSIPADASTIGRAYFVQGILVNPLAPSGSAVLLSNGLELRGGT